MYIGKKRFDVHPNRRNKGIYTRTMYIKRENESSPKDLCTTHCRVRTPRRKSRLKFWLKLGFPFADRYRNPSRPIVVRCSNVLKSVFIRSKSPLSLLLLFSRRLPLPPITPPVDIVPPVNILYIVSAFFAEFPRSYVIAKLVKNRSPRNVYEHTVCMYYTLYRTYLCNICCTISIREASLWRRRIAYNR